MDPEETPTTTTTTPPAAGTPPAAAKTPAAPGSRQEPTDAELEAAARDRSVAFADIRQREWKRAQKEMWGTDDPEEIEKRKAKRREDDERAKRNEEELTRIRTEQEQANRAKMSDVERLTADLATANAKIKQLETELADARSQVMGERTMNAISQCAIRHRVINDAIVLEGIAKDYGRAYNTLNAVEKRALLNRPAAERHLNKFMKKWAEDHPKFVEAEPPKKEPEVTTTTVVKPRVVQRPIGATGRTPAAPVRAPATPNRSPDMDENGKTTRPGQPNSMNAAELAAFRKKNGLRAS